jgi:hypothetical protein
MRKVAVFLSIIETEAFGKYAAEVVRLHPKLKLDVDEEVTSDGRKEACVIFRTKEENGLSASDFVPSNYEKTMEAYRKIEHLMEPIAEIRGWMTIVYKRRLGVEVTPWKHGGHGFRKAIGHIMSWVLHVEKKRMDSASSSSAAS